MGKGGESRLGEGPPLLPRRNSFNVALGSLTDVVDDMKCLKGMWFSKAHSSKTAGASSVSLHQKRLEEFYQGQAAACELGEGTDREY
jgi:hypothetical protein